MQAASLTSVLDEAGVRYELLPHAHTETAVAEANALGLSASEVAKTLIIRIPTGYCRAVLAAADRIDLGKLGQLYGETKKSIQLANEEDLKRQYPEFELGAVPPFGGAHDDAVVVDRRVAERESVVLEAGSHDESIRLATADLLRVTKAQIADICED
jgi:Ala-tRNA(Pro) deacylase